MAEQEHARAYFELLAELGLTKHYGSLDATKELLGLCRVSPGQRVLEVGCGVGATPVLLAGTHGCQVTGLDLIEKMLHLAKERARKRGVEDRVDFLAGDARALPFPDECFDVVLLESVTVFLEDKLGAVQEYARVIKPGGYLGFTEMTWLRPPEQKLVDIFQDNAMATALDAESWQRLLGDAGLEDVVGRSAKLDLSRESKSRLERYGRGEILKVLFNMLRLVIKDRETRKMFQDASGGLSRDMLDVVGYGVFAGRKSPIRR